ncbi:MAG: DUF5050 domain-containing protein [Candidatus Poribacteria bacterium]|nr:DUF5050 domain-containing protein [Candidatus Poribacteria bacterium]
MKTGLISIKIIRMLFTALFVFIALLIPLLSTAQTDKPDLATWLTEHPSVSQAIRWQDVNGIKAYPNWSSTQKADLLEMYQKVWNGEPLGLTDPPPNMLDLADDAYSRTMLSKRHAWPLFLAHVAYGLAVETGKWVPWSLTEYSQEELLELFDGSRMFRWHNAPKGYEIIYRGMPASPDFTFEFLNTNNIIVEDRLHTIGNLLDWCRYNMTHFIGGFTAKNAEAHWQYRGVTPISRVISGTAFYSDFWNAEMFHHHTGGCWGTTAFLREVLRVVNIPVKRADSVPAHRGHSLPYFMSEGKYLSHGDDPYVQGIRNFPIPIEELFIDQATYDEWFGPNVPPTYPSGLRSGGVGRRASELTIKYMHPPFYWINTDAGTLHQMIGTRPEPFIPSVQNAISLAKTSDKIYWTERTSDTSGNIRRANFDGTNVEHVKSVTGVPHGIAVDNSDRKIYITNSLGKIQRLNVDGSDFESKFITDLKSPRHIFVTSGNVYWTENNNKVRRASLRGTGINTIHRSSDKLLDILVYKDGIYWTKQTGVNSGKIQRASLSGANVRNIATLNDIPISIDFSILNFHHPMVAYREFLLWTTASGKIQQSDLYGQNVKEKDIITVATDLTVPGSFVLGAHIPRPVVPKYQRTKLYWIDTSNGTLHWFIGTSAELFLPNVRNATSLAVDRTQGKVFWTEKTSNRTGKVRRANLDGTHIEDVVSLTGIPNDLAIDTARGKIYLTNSHGVIQRINTDGSNFKPSLITHLKAPKHIALDVAAGKLYWSETTERIRQANLDGSDVKTFTKYSGNIGDIVVAEDKLYWIENISRYEGFIKRAFLNSKKVERFGSFKPIVGIAVDTEENRIYWSNSGGRIERGYIPGRSGEMKERYIALPRTTVIAGLGAPGSIAVGGDISEIHPPELQHPPMYWTDMTNGTLHRLINAKLENILPSVQNATSLAVDVAGGKIYWTEKITNRTGKIRRANLDGTNVHFVRSLTSVPYSIAIDVANGKLYLTNSWGKIQRLNVNGSNFQPNLVTGLDSPRHLALDVTGGKVYWTEETGQIRRASLDGTDIKTLVTDLETLGGIVLMNGKIYWTEKTRENSGKIQSANLDGTNPEVFTTLMSVPLGIAVDTMQRKLYWTDSRGTLQRADFTGENIQEVATGLGQPVGLILDSVSTDITIAAAPAMSEILSDTTGLLTNYPNPFNPETWIPYQLAKPAEVTLHIYAINGVLVRTLPLGHQPAGMYHSKSRAAYWDGRNEQGERLASGIYFYTLSVGDFTATRKLLIRK